MMDAIDLHRSGQPGERAAEQQRQDDIALDVDAGIARASRFSPRRESDSQSSCATENVDHEGQDDGDERAGATVLGIHRGGSKACARRRCRLGNSRGQLRLGGSIIGWHRDA